MLARTNPFNVGLAKQFAWLLRPDVRAAYASPEDPGFGEWWLVKGRQDFAGWADSAQPQELQSLFEANGPATIQGVNFEVPRVAQLFAKHRPDALREFTHEGKVHNELFFAWVVVRGLAEHRLMAHVPKSLLAALDQPLPATVPDANVQDAPPAATLLMYLVWAMMDKATQDSKNLFTPQGRQAFLPWFFGVVQPLGLGPLVAGRWKSWVKTQPGFQVAQLPWANPSVTSVGNASAHKDSGLPAPVKPRPLGLNIYGFAYGELGIGEDLRMAVECCKAAGIAYHVVNVDAGETGQADMHLKGEVQELSDGELPPYNTNLFCLPAFDMVSRVFMQKGASVFAGYRNIGWWPWELAVFPKAWRPYAFELVDEVWASSQFLFDMYSAATDKPVKLVPLAVSVERMKPHPRKHYGLPEKKFLFLYIFDFNSSVARKNPMAAVLAFKQAFKPNDKTVGLVLKTMNTKPNNPEWLAFLKECQADDRIQLITDTLERPAVLGLINACNAYVSLHRAEGFGRTLAEAMLLGKPVVATNFSGNVDFMDKRYTFPVQHTLVKLKNGDYQWLETADEAVWANAKLTDAASQMQKSYLMGDKKTFQNQTKEFALRKFAPKVISSSMQDKLSSSS